jgi:hypothetical protein
VIVCLRRIGIASLGTGLIPTLLLAGGMFWLVAAPLAFGQESAGDLPGQPDQTAQPDPQQQPGSPNPQGPANPPASSPNPAPSNVSQPFAVNPITGIATVSAVNYQPLTGKQRFALYWRQNFWSVGAYFGPFFTALVLDQATGSPKQWGGGFKGYGRRVASRIGSGVLQGSIQAGLAAALHQDVRYIASGQKGFKQRVRHAVIYSFLTYNSHGHPTLNIANLTGYYASTAISTTWLPGSRSVAGYTFSNGSEQVALSIPINILQEFWPEVRHKVFRRP